MIKLHDIMFPGNESFTGSKVYGNMKTGVHVCKVI